MFSIVGLAGLTLASACKSNEPKAEIADIKVPETKRNELVRRALVFKGVDNPSEKSELEIKNGVMPEGSTKGVDYFDWGQTVTCEFSDKNFEDPPGGMSPKFICNILDDAGKVVAKNVKIKYDKRNPEAYNEPAGSRLFWLLGFPADTYYTVKMNCIGCPPDEDVWGLVKRARDGSEADKANARAKVKALRDKRTIVTYDPAVIEKKFGEPIVVAETEKEGWSFADDLSIPKERLAFPPEQVDEELAKRHALAILAAMISHVDNQPGNQRITCTQPLSKTECAENAAWLVIHDLGATMGGFRLSWDVRTPFTDDRQLDIAMTTWSSKLSTAVFRGDRSCEVSVASAHPQQTLGPLKHVNVSEAGRRFLLSRFVALGGGSGDRLTPEVRAKLKEQLTKVFLAGRNGELYKGTQWWVDTLMSKLDIVEKHRGCSI